MDFASGLASLQKVAKKSNSNSSSAETNTDRPSNHHRNDPHPHHPPRSQQSLKRGSEFISQSNNHNFYNHSRNHHSNSNRYSNNHNHNNRYKNHNYNSHNRPSKRHQHDGRSMPRLSRNEDFIREKLQSIEPYKPEPNPSLTAPTYHLVLLFVTIDDLHYEDIWRTWMNDIDTVNKNFKVSVLCHAKNPQRVQSPWLQKRLLRRRQQYHSYQPKWGSVEITRAMIDLLRDGIHDRAILSNGDDNNNNNNNNINKQPCPPPDRFLFVSESCLPVQRLQYFYDELYGSDDNDKLHSDNHNNHQSTLHPLHAGKSWVNARNTPNNGYSRQLQFDRVHPAIPPSKIWKADQWILLTRRHAEATVKKNIPRALEGCPPLWEMFQHVKASDEIYFPTALSLVGVFPDQSTSNLNEEEKEQDHHHDDTDTDTAITTDLGPEVVKRRVTYCDWSEGDKNPVTFKGLRQFREVVMEAQKEGCLVARKFAPAEKQNTHSTDTDTKNNNNSTAKEKERKRNRSSPITMDHWKEIIKYKE